MLVAAIHEATAVDAKATLVSAHLAFGTLMQQQVINIFRRLSLADQLRERLRSLARYHLRMLVAHTQHK